MSEAKFTKGEWYVSNGIFVGVTGEGDDAIVSGVGLLSDAKANAHLIAAAPEMYEEIERDLESLYRFVKTLAEYSDDWLFYTNEIKRKECLLAKARGEHD